MSMHNKWPTKREEDVMRLLHKHGSATTAQLARDRGWGSSIGNLATQLVGIRAKSFARVKKIEGKFVFTLTQIGRKVHALGLQVERGP